MADDSLSGRNVWCVAAATQDVRALSLLKSVDAFLTTASSEGIDDPDITDHPCAAHYCALLRGAQTDLVVSQKHLHALFNRVCGGIMKQLARVDAREKFTHRLLP